MGNPEHMGVVRLLRGIDDEAAKKGMNIVEQPCKRPNVNVPALLVRAHRIVLCLFAGCIAPAWAVPCVLGEFFPINSFVVHDDASSASERSPRQAPTSWR